MVEPNQKGPKMRVILTTCLLLLTTIAPVSAQESLEGPFLYESGKSAGACTRVEAERGGYYCLNIGCNAQNAPYFALLSGSPTFTGDAALSLRLNGQSLGPLLLSPSHPFKADAYVWIAPYQPDRHKPLVDAMQRGLAGQALLAGQGGHEKWAVDFSQIRGTVDAILRSCGTPGTPLVPVASVDMQDMPPEAARILADIREGCAQSGGNITVGDGFVERPDLNDDGRPDLVVAYGAAACSAGPPQYCGSGGCQHEGFLAQPDGSFAPVFSALFYSYEIKAPGIVTFRMHGSACGLVGAAPCAKDFRVSDGGLELIQ